MNGGVRVLELQPQVRERLGLDDEPVEPNVPTTNQACMDVGWRNHTDDQNRPFRNQSGCVRYLSARD